MKFARQIFSRVAALWLFGLEIALSQTIPVPQNLWRLVAQEDTDGDQRITIHDHTMPFAVRDQNNAVVKTLTNFYQMSVLLQELKQVDDQHKEKIDMNQLQLDENIVDRTHRLIKDKFWDALTRRIDAEHIDRVVHDSKTTSKYDYIYVPRR